MQTLSLVFAVIWFLAFVFSHPEPEDIHFHIYNEHVVRKGSNRPAPVRTGPGRFKKKPGQKQKNLPKEVGAGKKTEKCKFSRDCQRTGSDPEEKRV